MSEGVTVLRNPREKSILRDCADIHMREIPGGFLPTFGRQFLIHLYDYLASSDKSFLLVAVREEKALGFICGSYGVGGIYKGFALRKALIVGFPVVWNIVRNRALKRVIETLRYPAGEDDGQLPGSEILNFCVDGSTQGLGVGGRLFEALCDEYRDRGIEAIRIVTGSDQVSAQRFYEKRGAREVSRIQVHEGHDSLVFVYQLQP